MSVVYYVKEGERMPFGHGVICYSHQMWGTETTLIPLNYLVRLWYWICRKYRPRKWECKLINAIDQAYELGRRKGSNDELISLIRKSVKENDNAN